MHYKREINYHDYENCNTQICYLGFGFYFMTKIGKQYAQF